MAIFTLLLTIIEQLWSPDILFSSTWQHLNALRVYLYQQSFIFVCQHLECQLHYSCLESTCSMANEHKRRRTLSALHKCTGCFSLLLFPLLSTLLPSQAPVSLLQTFVMTHNKYCLIFSCIHFVLIISPREQGHAHLGTICTCCQEWCGSSEWPGDGKANIYGTHKNTVSPPNPTTSSHQKASLDSINSS